MVNSVILSLHRKCVGSTMKIRKPSIDRLQYIFVSEDFLSQLILSFPNGLKLSEMVSQNYIE